MEELKNNGHPEGCKCHMCEGKGMCRAWGMGCTHCHYALRWILGIAILIAVFALGMKFGELKASLWSDYGYGGGFGMHYRPMMYYGGYDGGEQYPTMMRVQQSSTSTPQQ